MDGAHFPSFGTAAIHVGQEPEQWSMNQVVPVISTAATYKQTKPGVHRGCNYGRGSNPTRDALQRNLAALEDAKYCVAFASGMAATSAVVNILKAGDHIICSEGCYGGTHRLLEQFYAPQQSIETTFLDLTREPAVLQEAIKENTKLLWIESPSNPLMTVVDIAAVVTTAKRQNPKIIVVVDNTFMSPYFQRPLSLGADIVVHSLTKYISGHSDVIMGGAFTDRDDIKTHLSFQQRAIGGIPSPFDCYLVNRSTKTLHLRMRAHYENALAVAHFLEGHSAVERVLYPALPSHPQFAVHQKQTLGSSGVLSFYLRGGLEEREAFLDALKVFTLGESLGGVESLVGIPVIMTHSDVPEEERLRLGITDNLIRLSVGVEDKEDLIADLSQALRKSVEIADRSSSPGC